MHGKNVNKIHNPEAVKFQGENGSDGIVWYSTESGDWSNDSNVRISSGQYEHCIPVQG